MSAVTTRSLRRSLLRRGAAVLSLTALAGVSSFAGVAGAEPTGQQGAATASWVSEGEGYNGILNGGAAVIQNVSVEGSADPTGTFCIQHGVDFLPNLGDPALITDGWDSVVWEAFRWDEVTSGATTAEMGQGSWIAQQYELGFAGTGVTVFEDHAQFIGFTDYPTTGDYTISVGAETAAPVAVTADAATVQAALAALPGVAANGGVTVTGSPGSMVITLGDATPTLISVTDTFDLGDVAVTADFGAPANASAAQLAIWNIVNGQDISGTVNAEILNLAEDMVAAAAAVTALPTAGTIGYNLDANFAPGIGPDSFKVVAHVESVNGTGAVTTPLTDVADDITVTVNDVALTLVVADDPTTDTFEYETAEFQLDTTVDTVAAASFTGVVAAGSPIRVTSDGVTGQESMLITDASVTRTASDTIAAAGGGDPAPGGPQDPGTTPTTAPPADPTDRNQLPVTGGWVTLPVLLGASAAGALGIWLRRRGQEA